MNTKTNEPSEREEIEMLLPWHAAGTLSRRDAQRVEQALARDAELTRHFALVREELGETIHLNETLGAPTARAMDKLLAGIEAESGPAQQSRRGFGLGTWMTERLAALSPRTLAWSAAAAVLALALQAGLLASMYVGDRAARNAYEVASEQSHLKDGSFLRISFVPSATAVDITLFLQSNKIAIVEGPIGGAFYRIRAAETALPKEEVNKLAAKLRAQSGIIQFVATE
jgi:anti-sigma-K factor RskA